MKKLYSILALSLMTGSLLNAQTVFTSNFTTVGNGMTTSFTDWSGQKTSLEADSTEIITSGSLYGNSSVQLINAQSSHKRFTSNAITLDSNETYLVELWVKGEGEIRTNYFSNDYGIYNNYVALNESSWTKIEQTISPEQTSDTAELIISIRNTVGIIGSGHIMIDSVALTVEGGTPSSITELESARLNFYPNPATDKILVELEENSTLSIFDLKGRLMFSVNVSKGLKTIDVSDLVNGYYTLHLQTESGKFKSEKFSINK